MVRKRWQVRAKLAFCALALVAPASARQPETLAPAPRLARIEIGQLGAARLAALVADPELFWWVELDRTLVVLAPEAALARLARHHEVKRLEPPPGSGPLVFVRDLPAAGRDDLVELARGGRWTFARLREPPPSPPAPWPRAGERPAWASASGDEAPALLLVAFRPRVVLARAGANLPGAGAPEASLAVDPALVDLVDVDRWFAAVSTLASWNRWTRGPQILAARDWLAARFAELPGVSVATSSFPVPPSTTGWNVIATLPGLRGGGGFAVVGGHYDATSESPATAAPGAEDNASGCAGVLELARVFADRRPNLTLVFVCYAGEEQGLYGSAAHAQSLVDAGLAPSLRLMLNMDMIGYSGDADLDCLLETDPPYAGEFTRFQAAASAFTTLRLVTDTNACCSDHAPFLDRGMPAVLTIENDYSSYPHYHRSTDLPGALTPVMAENILRMNVAVLADLAGMPLFADGFETGDGRWWSAATP